MLDLPDKALSIRQPWAWAIINEGKSIENRSRRFNYRGPICIHASLYKPRPHDYQACFDVLDTIHGNLTMLEVARQQGRQASAYTSHDSARGYIIGTATIVDCVDTHDSPWFFGPWGLVLADVKPVEHIPVRGRLGLFDWRSRL